MAVKVGVLICCSVYCVRWVSLRDGQDARVPRSAWRRHGCRRYDSMDGGGRAASGTAAESNAGAVAGCARAASTHPTIAFVGARLAREASRGIVRSEEHTSEFQSL